ncbi:D-tagatose-bisphosphate aldolase, class II, non-catalytic subunit [Paracidobacterium acidisoli]|uniref:D-tagatose-bisphosphate aldolase, class II, non-catalytic subunit n=1 Tax=Paracidobacterium acidisoli TaxID=2303751 RepID=A0A372IUQ7_9BACT|nr:D-tagatose-bisphosphate aldolase, class II, non-catalytic subunit [Paracidobacterium acidisoli]MBT9330111.1 D-tagatose-bisphosphate aldolase, class II, non-catalytic subunit [Paracidobacterium acidisoli]
MTTYSGFDLKDLAHERAQGKFPGIYSVCSAHPWVLEAAMRSALDDEKPLLIEATCNQVNQFGGYTGMKPKDFCAYVESIAKRVGFPTERLLLGGDHLGPHPWRHLPAAEAMKNATDLVADFVQAGFTKIHLDTSMPCEGDPVPFPDEVIAERAAALAKVAEGSAGHDRLRYVIGTEVPTPGGSVEELSVSVTRPEASEQALSVHREAFSADGIDDAWKRVIALVVQPGVEFGHEDVVDYDAAKAQTLCTLLGRHSELIFEAHSTDYQKPEAYAQLVRDGFAILKVGPALTFAMREALLALEAIERYTVPEGRRSHLEETLQRVMKAHPENWEHHYHGDALTVERLLIHSYSDRVRYYWHDAEIAASVSRLIENLEQARIPETLLSAYLPVQYERVREGSLENAPVALILDQIITALRPYQQACRG